MIYLELKQVSKSYGEKVLFDRVDLPINKGAKTALIAKNGTGKSTLLRVAAGIDLPEGVGSSIYVHKEARLAYLPQEPDFGTNQTVLDAVFDSDNEVVAAVRAYEEALLLGADGEKLQKALSAMDRLGGWDIEAKMKETLSKLAIRDIQQPISTLSGGQRKRVALAKLIIDEPDMIIMDEPTNHLDLDMIEWLEEWLQDPKLSLLMVTHDRYFLERVCDTIIELEGGVLYRYSGNYSDYLEKKAMRQETTGAEFEKDKKRLKKELAWVRRMPQARSTKAKSRVHAYDKLKDKVDGFRREDELQIDIKGQRLGKKILEAHNVSKSYGELELVKFFDYKFRAGERVGIVGPNGVGKSTFLGLLTEEIRPDTGKVVVGDNTVFGYYTQDGIQLRDDQRVIEVVQDIAEYIPLEKGLKLTAASLLERFLFDRKQQQVYVSQLSGGERRRLYLLTILMKNPNFLILDEPTNDLDILTINVLEDFLMDFPGCILIVSHDRFFLDKLAQHLFVFEGQGIIRDWNDTFTAYREMKKEEAAQHKSEKTETIAAAPIKENQLSQEQRKAINRLENQIAKLEVQKQNLSEQFNRAQEMSTAEIAELGKKINELSAEIEMKELEWMELMG